MHIFKIVKFGIINAVKQLINQNIEFSVEIPKNPLHGDIAINIAMILTAIIKKPAIEIAHEIVDILRNDQTLISLVQEYNIVMPGFINITLLPNVLYAFLNDLVVHGSNAIHSSICDIGNNKKINIEFVSANPTGPMHIGHARSAIYGDVLCNLLRKCGFNVYAEYYINDAGVQIDKLTKSLYIRYKQLLNEDVELTEDCYPGEYLVHAAQKFLHIYGENITQNDNNILREFAVNEMMSIICDDLKQLKVKHDIFTSEAKLIKDGVVQQAIELLKSKNLVYQGILDQPKSSHEDDWEAKEQLLFKSTMFGDDSDRTIIKSNGEYSYFASDIALHLQKIKQQYNELYLVLGADHAGYVTRIRASVKAMTNNQMDLHVIINQLVNIYKDGQPIRMSKRKGNFLTVDDVLSEIDCDILRFAMMSQKNSTVLDIDCDKLLEQTNDNQLFYIQYAHTRIVSIINNSHMNNIFKIDEIYIKKTTNNDLQYFYAPKSNVNFTLLQSNIELNIIKNLIEFSKLLELCAKNKEPHRITYYLYELANKFHNLWHAGVLNHNMRCIIHDQIELSQARISLIYGIAVIIQYGLNILGIQPLIEM